MFAPHLQLAFGYAESGVPCAPGAMKRDGASIDDDSLSLSVLGIENEQNAFLTAEHQLSAGNGENLFEAKNTSIEAIRQFQVVHV